MTFDAIVRYMVKGDEKNDDDLDKIAKSRVTLEGKDYLALAIASLETIFLPLIILTLVVLALVFLLR